MDYRDFLASKRMVVPSNGHDVAQTRLHPALFPFQRDLVRWAIRKGRAAIFADTGMGKTLMQLAWAQHAADRVLILAPLAVAHQTVAEGARFGIPVTYARDQSDAATSGITITNYEMLPHFDPATFGAVVLDECFAKGTQIRTGGGWKHIEDVRIGEIILNACGWDVVSDIHRREVPYAVRVTVDGRSVVSSPNHPYFTQCGWVAAQDLIPGDHLMETAAAVRSVWRNVHAEVSNRQESTLLRDILLSEMANESARTSGEGAYARSCTETRRETSGMVGVKRSSGSGRSRAHSSTQSDKQSGGTSKDIPPIERDAPRTFRAWGQWSRTDDSATTHAGHTREGMASGVLFVSGSADSWLSHALQTRLSATRAKNLYRAGWQLALQPQGCGCEERCPAHFSRVDRVEVLESGHPDLERLRDSDGKFYFYDLGGTRHPSFAVALGPGDTGVLVHNSSILKNFEGKVRSALIAAFRDTPRRLCCTATPAPNDTAELANHAEFLGVLSRVDMLATFFVHDDAGWRLKGHARQPFYRWLASWGMSLKKPSDIGYSDEGYGLPLLAILSEIVSAGHAPPGYLFAIGLKGITDRTTVRRETLDARVERAAALVGAEPGEQWLLWCGLNDEGRALHDRLLGSVLVEGADSPEAKADALTAFARGEVRVLITKPSIAGFGMNFQTCARMAFVGLSDSYEQYYQAIRRCWRYGQAREVRAYIVLSDLEESIYANVLRKEQEAARTAAELVQHVAQFERAEIASTRNGDTYHAEQPMQLPAWLEAA